MIGLTNWKNWLTFVGDPVPDTDHFSTPHSIAEQGFQEIYHLPYSRRQISTTLGEMTHADNVMKPQHFGSNLADIRIRIGISPDANPGSLLIEVRCLGGGLRSLSTV